MDVMNDELSRGGVLSELGILFLFSLSRWEIEHMKILSLSPPPPPPCRCPKRKGLDLLINKPKQQIL